MKQTTDSCVGCTSLGMSCLGSACRNSVTEVIICDKCKENNALYNIDDTDYCEECIEEELDNIFKDLAVFEKVDVLRKRVDIWDVVD